MKRWYQSKTVLVNLVTLVAGLLVVVQDTEWVMSEYGGVVLVMIGAVNVILRFITRDAVK